MLDDLKYIHQRDGQDALGIAERQWQQLQHSYELKVESLKLDDIANIVYAGMGGSALAALLSVSWPGYNIPFEICRQYQIPAYVSNKTLFIASSYSGNTEETLAALNEAEKKAAKIIVITNGGKLQQIAQEKNYPIVPVPDASQPRYAVLYNLKAVVTILCIAGLVENRQLDKISEASGFLKQKVAGWTATVPTKDNSAKKLAEELTGKSVVIYAGPLLAPAAYKWKININENAKNVAWYNQLPEFNHNEMIGWINQPIQKPYAIVDLRSNLEHPRIQKRFEVTEKLLSGQRPAPNVVQVQGETILEQLLWAVAYGDFVSIYLALLNNVNPSPVDLVEKFKKALEE